MFESILCFAKLQLLNLFQFVTILNNNGQMSGHFLQSFNSECASTI